MIQKDGSVSSYYDDLCLNTSTKLFLASGLQLDGLINLPEGNWYSWKELRDILHQVPSKYNIEPRLCLNTEVVKIDKLKNDWNVLYQNEQGNQSKEFEFVVCCTGSFRFPKFPEIPNMDKFNGLSLHNLQIRHYEKLFPGKKVPVIGGNYSGSDTVYLALQNQVDKVYWCLTRKPEATNTTIFKRNSESNDPNKAFHMEFNRLNWFGNPELLQQYVESIGI
jgi:cation diffusion facilitator CzcD-associated flavoprotein CzcO